MALNYSDVSPGDTILAAHPNALLDDIEQHNHDGTDTSLLANLSVDTAQLANDGVTGIKTTELLYDVHRQNYTTDNAVADQTLRKGWKYVEGDATTEIETTITFGITFDNIPIVVATAAGIDASAPASTDLGDYTTKPNDGISVFIYAITTTGFSVSMFRVNGFSSGIFYAFTWMAIGTKAK